MGSLSQKTEKRSFGTIGAPVALKVQGAGKPWDSDVFAPDPIQPSPDSVDRPKAKKKEKKRPESVSQRFGDRQLGVLEDEGY